VFKSTGRLEPFRVENLWDELWVRGDKPIELGDSWFSPRLLYGKRRILSRGVEYYLGAGGKLSVSRQTPNTRCTFRQSDLGGKLLWSSWETAQTYI
jgi:hypothetical protein